MLKYNNLQIEWLGNSTIKIKTKREVIYIDPYALYDQEPANIILITHEHSKHCDPETIKRISKEFTLIITPKYASRLIKKENKKIIYPGETIEVEGLKITATHAYEITRAQLHYRGKGVGYIIDINGTKIYHAGDTDFIPEISNIKNIDIACYPIADFENDVQQAVDAINTIKPKFVIPLHYDPSDRKKLYEFESKIVNSKVVLG